MFALENQQPIFMQPRFIKAILIILVVILLISVFKLFSTGIMPAKQTATAEKVAPVQTKAFAASPLFGQSPAGVLQQTRLNLILKGTFSAAHPSMGSAIIGGPDKKDEVYVVGDTVDGAVIQDIEADYIVLEYKGNKEILRLPEGKRLTSQ
jgi:type II secretory pathway component PulC